MVQNFFKFYFFWGTYRSSERSVFHTIEKKILNFFNLKKYIYIYIFCWDIEATACVR